MTRRRREAGFTGNELSDRLVPCVIFGILAAIAFTSFRSYKATADAKKDLLAIEAAEREHRKAHGAWMPFDHKHGEGDLRVDELSLDLEGAEDVVAIAEAGSNGALVLRASGGRLKKPIEQRVEP